MLCQKKRQTSENSVERADNKKRDEGGKKKSRHSIYSLQVRLEDLCHSMSNPCARTIVVVAERAPREIYWNSMVGSHSKMNSNTGLGVHFVGFLWENSSCSSNLPTEVTNSFSQVLKARILFFPWNHLVTFWLWYPVKQSDRNDLCLYQWMRIWAFDGPYHWHFCLIADLPFHSWKPIVKYYSTHSF